MITPEQLAASSTEDGHQLALFCWIRLHPEYPHLNKLTHIPNGGSRNKAEAAKLKAMGVQAGFTDLFLPVPILMKSHGLFIELKNLKMVAYLIYKING